MAKSQPTKAHSTEKIYFIKLDQSKMASHKRYLLPDIVLTQHVSFTRP